MKSDYDIICRITAFSTLLKIVHTYLITLDYYLVNINIEINYRLNPNLVQYNFNKIVSNISELS